MKTCYLKPTTRGCFVGALEERWKIADKVDIPKGAQFVVWPLGNEKRGPKLLELAAPGADISQQAILIAKLFYADRNRYYGTRRVNLSGRMEVTTKADFNLYENDRDLGLTVR